MMIDFLNRVFAGAYFWLWGGWIGNSVLDFDSEEDVRLMIPIVGGFVGLAKYKYQSNAEVARHRSSIIGSSAESLCATARRSQQETVELHPKSLCGMNEKEASRGKVLHRILPKTWRLVGLPSGMVDEGIVY